MDDYFEENSENHNDLPVLKKANDILKVTFALSDIIDKEKDELMLADQMLSNALTIPSKIAGAEGGNLYSIRFDNATLIKLSARELLAQASLVEKEGLCDKEYVQLLRDEIEEFRILFLNWVSSFDKDDDLEDEWNIRDL